MSELDLLRRIADLEARLARLESAGAPYTTTSAGAMTTPALNVGSATGATTGGVFTQASANNQYVLRFNDTSGNNRAGYQYQSDGTYDADLRNASGTTTIGLNGSAGTISLSGGLNVGSASGAPAGALALQDGITAPSATSGAAKLYVDTADGDLKIIFGDGTIKTIATDT